MHAPLFSFFLNERPLSSNSLCLLHHTSCGSAACYRALLSSVAPRHLENTRSHQCADTGETETNLSGNPTEKSECQTFDLISFSRENVGLGSFLQIRWCCANFHRDSGVNTLFAIERKKQERQVRFLDGKEPLEEGIATTPIFLLGKYHGQKSLVFYGPCGHRKMYMTEHTLTPASGKNYGERVSKIFLPVLFYLVLCSCWVQEPLSQFPNSSQRKLVHVLILNWYFNGRKEPHFVL